MSVTPIKSVEARNPEYRQVPHNVEAEQALLGAILRQL